MDDQNLEKQVEKTNSESRGTAPIAPPAPDSAANTPNYSPEKSGTDVLGILSLVAVFIFMQIPGLIIGLIGASKAKKEGRSPTLSRIGWILNAVIIALAIPMFMLFLASFKGAQEKAKESREKYEQGQSYIEKKQVKTDENDNIVNLKKGEAIKAEGLSIKVDSVTRNYVPVDKYDQARDGKELIVLDITVTNDSQKNGFLYTSALKLIEGQKEQFSSYAQAPGTVLKSSSIAAGETTKGQLVYEVIKDAKDLKLSYTGYSVDKESYKSTKTKYKLEI